MIAHAFRQCGAGGGRKPGAKHGAGCCKWLADSDAELMLAQAKKATAEPNLSYTRITAPIGGVIGKKSPGSGSVRQTAMRCWPSPQDVVHHRQLPGNPVGKHCARKQAGGHPYRYLPAKR